ncbi:MAG: flagellin [Acidobacteriota bacterium]
MRVTFSTNIVDLEHAIATAAADMATHQRELSTGRRINVLSDDPTAASAAIAERTEMAVTDRYKAAADTATSRLSIVDSSLTALINQATAAQSAVMSARTSTATPAQREAAAANLEAIRDSVVSLMNTNYRGSYIFSGNTPTVAPYTKTGSVVSSYLGGTGTVSMDVDRQASVQIAFSSDAILKGSDSKDLIRVLEDLAAAARDPNGSAALQAGTAALDSAFARLTSVQTKVGNDMAQIDIRQQELTTRHLSSQTRLSSLEDADLSNTISDMNRASTAYQAALKAASTASHATLMDYLS